MKVVEAPIWWQFECRSCHAKCEAEPKDVTGRANIDSDGDVVGVIPVVECGRCGKEHDVPDALLTEKIETIAEKKYKRRHRDD